jgi:leucyl aminopeptidase
MLDQYTDITYVESQCGYACSDHGSATRNGYPASVVFEAAFEDRNPQIHTGSLFLVTYMSLVSVKHDL